MNNYYSTDILKALFNQIIAKQIMGGGDLPKAKPKKISCTRRKLWKVYINY